jgi:ArsR family metal-binding transcriptional regulator
LLQKFESFLQRLPNVINKGLDGELVASKIKEVKVKRTEEVQIVLPTFETKKEVETVILAFAIKLEHVEEEEVVQKKAELNGIPKLM